MSGETNREMRDEERVKSRAYALWEQEGRPHGRDKDHWSQAEQEFGGQSDGGRQDGGASSGPDQVTGTVADIPVVRKRQPAQRKAAKPRS